MQKLDTNLIHQVAEQTYEVHFRFNPTHLNCIWIETLLLFFSYGVYLNQLDTKDVVLLTGQHFELLVYMW